MASRKQKDTANCLSWYAEWLSSDFCPQQSIHGEPMKSSFRSQIGLVLRQAWFINGCFFNSEVWNGYTDTDLADLIVIDHQIMRLITNCQAKVPVEMLYLETAELPIQGIISVRRLLYLHEILSRNDSELINQVYCDMKESPLKDDWIHLVLKDKLKID